MTFFQFLETWDSTDTTFIIMLTLAILIMLYTMSLMHTKIRLLENEVQNLRKDQSVVSEELELMAKMKNGTEL